MQSDVAQQPAPASGGGMLGIVSWISLGVTLALSFTSFLGFGIWLLPFPVAAATLVMGIIALKRHGKSRGISLIVAAALIIPLSFVAQIVSLAVYGTSAMKEQEWQETQMLENLRTIDRAKGAWGSETGARKAAPVTLADLTSYLGGKKIIPVVGERYDPRPVGTDPTATLPDGKHLWDYPTGGAAYTAAGLEQILSQRSYDPINMASGQFLHPSDRWLPGFWKTAPSPAAAATVSPPPTPEEQ
jgi:hypothetical protein